MALVLLCAGQLMIIIDQTIVNVALPSVQSDLGFSQSGLAWVVNVYLIAFGGLLLLFGRLGDLLGRKRVFVAGLILFTLASLLCGLAQGQGALIEARFVQGVGGAMASSVVLGMIFAAFPEPRELAKAIGFFSFVAAAGGALGPLAGGVLTEAISWHWIFFVNVPVGVAATVLAARVLEAERGLGFAKGADVPGALLVTAGLMTAVYAIVGVTDHGWGSAHTLDFGAFSIVLLAGFVVRQASVATPILPLRVFRSRLLSGANLVQALMVAGMFGFLFLGTLYVRRVLGYGAMATGLAFLPTPAAIAAISLFLSAPLNARFGERRVLLAGLSLIVTGLGLLARAPTDGDYVVDVLPAMLLLGFGFGAAMPALTALAMSGVAPGDSGLASGLFNTTQQVGGALGLAVLATLATLRTESLLAEGQDTASALTSGYHLAFAVGASFMVTGIVLAAIVLGPDGARAGEEGLVYSGSHDG
jgi:EmrB/QacA subfamily drug resistance transporter